MNREIKNRTEAYLSWLSTGIQPEGWDLEQPRNKQEVWLLQKAQRLDRIERENGENGGEVETGRKAALRSSNEGTYDYNALDNIPILPMPADERVEEGQFYHKESEENYSALQIDDNMGIGAILHIDTTKSSEVETYLNSLTFDPQSSPMLFMATTTRMNTMLVAMDLHMMDPTIDSGYGIMLQNGQDLHGFIYSTWAGTLHTQTGDIELTVGFQENFLDENGNIELIYAHDTLSTLVETALPELWNGVFVFKTEVSPEAIGQIVNNEFVPLAVKSNEPVASSLYQHNIKLGHQTYGSNTEGLVTICNDSITTFDYTSLRNYLKDYSTYNYYTASGLYNGEYIYGIYVDANSYISLIYGQDSSVSIDSSELIVTDNPIEIL